MSAITVSYGTSSLVTVDIVPSSEQLVSVIIQVSIAPATSVHLIDLTDRLLSERFAELKMLLTSTLVLIFGLASIISSVNES